MKLICTKEKFKEYHVMLWDLMIEEYANGGVDIGGNFTISDLKGKCFAKLFGSEYVISGACFGCEWSVLSTNRNEAGCPDCLFDNANIEEKGCLDGLFSVVCAATREGNKTLTLSLMARIRDFPIKP